MRRQAAVRNKEQCACAREENKKKRKRKRKRAVELDDAHGEEDPGEGKGWLRHVTADFFLISTRRHHWGKKRK